MTLAWTEGLAAAPVWAIVAVALPLACGLAAIPLGRHARHLAVPAAGAGLVIAVGAALQVARDGPVGHAVGGWAPPLGIVIALDGLAAAFLVMAAVVTAAVALIARSGFDASGSGESRAAFAFWPLLFFMGAGLNAVFVGADLFNLYVALELLTLTAVAMVALDGKAETIAAAMRYLLFALMGSLAYLLGVVLLYGAYGTLDMDLLREAAEPNRVTIIAGAVMTAGLIAKTALFPLHAWLPPAHAGAPAPASAMLSALVVKASFYVIVRLWFDVLPTTATASMTDLLGALGAAAILFGSCLALRQRRLKLIVAYSTVAQLGYLFLMFPLAGGAGAAQPWSAPAWTGGIFHALAHAPAKAAMFLVAGMMMKAVGHDRLDGLVGVARDLPIAAFAFGLAGFSIMGLPPSGGFTAKYLLLTSALASGQWWLVAVMIAGGLLAAGYVFRVLNRFVAEPDMPSQHTHVPRGQQLVALALAACALLLGLLSLAPYELLQIGSPVTAAEGLS